MNFKNLSAEIVFCMLSLATACQADLKDCDMECDHLSDVPSDYSYKGIDVPMLALFCIVTSNCSLDVMTLVDNYTNPEVEQRNRNSDKHYLSIDVYVKCTGNDRLLDFARTTAVNKTILTTVRVQDCSISWDEIIYLDSKINLIGLESIVTSSDHIIVPTKQVFVSLANLYSLKISLVNFTQEVNLEKLLPSLSTVLKDVSSFSIQCFKRKIGVTRGQRCDSGTVTFSSSQLWKVFPHLQSLELEGAYNGNDGTPLGFPWDSNRSPLPCNLSYSKFSQKLHVNKHWIHSNMVRRAITISGHKHINITSICFMQGVVDQVVLNRNHLTFIPPTCFANTTNVSYVDLTNNEFGKLPIQLFSRMTALQELHLADIRLKEMHVGLFDDLISLQLLDLDQNHLRELQTGIFVKLLSLQKLFIHHNHIQSVEPGSLPTYSDQLTYVGMQWNHLQTIPFDCLTLPNLCRCVCDHNDISLGNLYDLVHHFNPIRMNFVQPLAFHGESYRFEDVGVTHEATQAEISLLDCNITEVAYNDNNAWSPEMKKKLAVFLGFFQITMGTTQNGTVQLKCDCGLYNLRNFILNSLAFSSTGRYPHAFIFNKKHFQSWVCEINPLILKNKQGKQMPFLDLDIHMFLCRNDTIPRCPADCICYSKPSDKSITIDCSLGKRTKLPPSLPIPDQGQQLILTVEHNRISHLPSCEREEYHWLHNITFLNFKSNLLAPSENDLKLFLICLKNIQQLYLDYNNIRSLPKYISYMKISMLSVNSHTLDCNCCNYWMKEWLQSRRKHIYFANLVQCGNKVLPIVQLDKSDFTCEDLVYVRPLVSAICILVAGAITSIALYAYEFEVKIILFEKFNWHPFNVSDDSVDKEYHVILIYSNADQIWVHGTLLNGLEQLGYRVFLMRRDSRVGAPEAEELATALANTHRVVVVVSQRFIDDVRAMTDFYHAYQHDKTSTRSRFLVLLKLDKDINFREDTNIFKRYINTNYFIPVNAYRFWSRLRYWLPRMKNKELPTATDNLQPSDENRIHRISPGTGDQENSQLLQTL